MGEGADGVTLVEGAGEDTTGGGVRSYGTRSGDGVGAIVGGLSFLREVGVGDGIAREGQLLLG